MGRFLCISDKNPYIVIALIISSYIFFFSVKHIADNENAVLETHLLGVHYRKFFTPDQFFHYEMVAKTFFLVNFIADNPPKITHQSE